MYVSTYDSGQQQHQQQQQEDVVMSQDGTTTRYGSVLFVVFVTLACLDGLYALSSMAFVWGWGEGRPSMAVVTFILRSLFLWGCILGIFYGVWEAIGTVVEKEEENPDSGLLVLFWIISVIGFLIVMGLFVFNVQKTRRMIVNGGSPPDLLQMATHLVKSYDENNKQPKEPEQPPTTTTSSSTQPQTKEKTAAASLKQPPQQSRRNTFTVVITGANTGIGKETVQQILHVCMHAKEQQLPQPLDVQIILFCRSVAKGNQAIQEIIQTTKTNTYVVSSSMLQVIPCDLTSFQSVRSAVQQLLLVLTKNQSPTPNHPPKHVDVLINNAGVMMKDMVWTVDGYETCLQANVLGHFLLTALLLPHIHPTRGRIVNLTSSTYRLAIPTFHPNQLDAWSLGHRNKIETANNNNKNKQKKKKKKAEKDQQQQPEQLQNYTLFGQYAATKWMNILHTRYLHDHLPHIFTAAVHPGLVRTDVVRNMPWYLRIPNTLFATILATLQKTPAAGAWGTLHVTFPRGEEDGSHHLPSGAYWVNRTPQPLIVQDDGVVQQQAIKVWNWCCEVVLTKEERKTLEQFFKDHSKTQTNKTK